MFNNKEVNPSEISAFQKYFVLFLLGLSVAVIYRVPYMREFAYTPLREGLGISHEQVGDIYAILGLVGTFSYIVGGMIADKFKAKNLIVVSLLGAGACIFWYATLPSLFLVKVIHGLLGIFGLMVFWCAYLKGIRMMGTDEEQGRMFGFTEGARGVLSTVTALAGVYVLELGVTKVAGLENILYFYGVLHIIVAALIWVVMPNVKAASSDDASKFSFSAVKDVIKLPGLWAVTLIIFGLYNVFALLSYTSPYLEEVWMVPVGVVGVLGTIRTYFIQTIGSPAGGYYGDKVAKSSTKALIQGCILLIAVLATFIFLPSGINNYFVIGLVLLLAFMLYAVRGVQFATMGPANIPMHLTGTALGVICTLSYLPDVYAFKMVGSWLDKYPKETAYNMVFGYLIICTGIAILGGIWVRKIALKNAAEQQFNELSVDPA